MRHAATVPLVIVGALTLVAVSGAVTSVAAIGGQTYVVNKTGDASDRAIGDAKCDTSTKAGNQCTLRAAIQETNNTAELDTIKFNITTTPRVIAPVSELPAITQSLLIDGYSQSGSSMNTAAVGNNAVLKITLDGINAGPTADGLIVGGYKSVVQGLNIQRFKASGIILNGTQDQVYGSFIGTNLAGTAARGNAVGISMNGSFDIVGSSLPKHRNVISGNTLDGVRMSGEGGTVANNYIGTRKGGAAALANAENGVKVLVAGTTVAGNVISANGGSGVHVFQLSGDNGSKIQGNFIGTNAAGTAALPNHTGVFAQANGVTVGGTAAGARNVISGNETFGVLIYHLVSGNVIQGNYIGTNAAGTAAIGNGSEGILTQDSDFTSIGGNTDAARNVVSGNGASGISLVGGHKNSVQGNYIGTKADKTGDLGNELDGITIVGSTQNTIGGTGASGNTISGNDQNGVLVNSTSTSNVITGNAIIANTLSGIRFRGDSNGAVANSIVGNGQAGISVGSDASNDNIQGNQILSNGALGIELEGPNDTSLGVTANDTDDPDTGGNDLQNYPVLTSALRSTATGVTTVSANLNSNPSTQFTIELFMAVADGSGHGEALAPVATKTVTTNSGGDVSFTISVTGVAPGQLLTATATSATGNTSEFSSNINVGVIP